jgi:hypothetical protein
VGSVNRADLKQTITMIKTNESFLNCFPSVHRAVEVAIVSGLKIKPFCRKDQPNMHALENIRYLQISHLFSMTGDIFLFIDTPAYADTANVKYRKNIDDIEIMEGELRKIHKDNSPFPQEPLVLSDTASGLLLKTAFERLEFTIHDYMVVRRVAYAIALLDKTTMIKTEHLAEAIHYRTIRPFEEMDGSINYGDNNEVNLWE